MIKVIKVQPVYGAQLDLRVLREMQVQKAHREFKDRKEFQEKMGSVRQIWMRSQKV